MLSVVDNYSNATEKYDKRLAQLRREVKRIEKEMVKERMRLVDLGKDHKGVVKVNVVLLAEEDAEVELVLAYSEPISPALTACSDSVIDIKGASRKALFDIRVKTDTQDDPVEFVYKAAIQQSTGEVRLFFR